MKSKKEAGYSNVTLIIGIIFFLFVAWILFEKRGSLLSSFYKLIGS